MGCNDDSPSENEERKYTGITRTGPDDPTPLGIIDPDDWYFNPDSSAIYNSFIVFPAYPNPSCNHTILTIRLPRATYTKIWMDNPMVDKETILLDRLLEAGGHAIQVNLLVGDNNDLLVEGIVRVFFEFDSLKTYPLLHGDIEISKKGPDCGKI